MDVRTFLFVLALYLLSGVLNGLLAFKTPEQWQAYVESSPRGAAAMKLLRKFGLDLPGVLRIVLPALARALAQRTGGKDA